ncbi:MAG: alkaline phosphatase, partial [Myxococcota bacterium]|nr:alkaline phosphatase [Myxococcota bacterium]
ALALLLSAPALGLGRENDPYFKAGREAVARSRALLPVGPPARNVILFIGDGMDGTTVTAARILEGQLRGESGEENWLSFEQLPFTALVKTYNTNMQVPDSAGTMTAMVSGLKTKAGVIGVSDAVVIGDVSSVAASRVPTLLEEAEDRGLATGVVSTTRLTHATPAACYAHAASRDWEVDGKLSDAARDAGFPDIARQMIEFDHGDGMEVMLGGGRSFFLPEQLDDPEEPGRKGGRTDGRNLVEVWQQTNPDGSYVWSEQQLLALDPKTTPRVLGLFDPSHMEYEADRAGDVAGEPSLAQMTAFAIALLESRNAGYFLMVEAGRIDHGHHAGNAYRALVDTIALSDAVRKARELTDPAETLIIVTADHGHTMSMAGYPKRGNPILGLVEAPEHPRFPGGATKDASGKPYTTLGYANGPGHVGHTNVQPAGPKRFPHASRGPFESTGLVGERPLLDAATVLDPAFLQESTVPLRSETHGGQDVAVWAGGPRAGLFRGSQEQSYLYHAMVEALGWREQVVTEPATGGAEAP